MASHDVVGVEHDKERAAHIERLEQSLKSVHSISNPDFSGQLHALMSKSLSTLASANAKTSQLSTIEAAAALSAKLRAAQQSVDRRDSFEVSEVLRSYGVESVDALDKMLGSIVEGNLSSAKHFVAMARQATEVREERTRAELNSQERALTTRRIHDVSFNHTLREMLERTIEQMGLDDEVNPSTDLQTLARLVSRASPSQSSTVHDAEVSAVLRLAPSIASGNHSTSASIALVATAALRKQLIEKEQHRLEAMGWNSKFLNNSLRTVLIQALSESGAVLDSSDRSIDSISIQKLASILSDVPVANKGKRSADVESAIKLAPKLASANLHAARAVVARALVSKRMMKLETDQAIESLSSKLDGEGLDPASGRRAMAVAACARGGTGSASAHGSAGGGGYGGRPVVRAQAVDCLDDPGILRAPD